MKIVIVGGVAGGATAAARIRRLDEAAEILIFERTEYISYANCGLPYYIGGVIADPEELTLQTPEKFWNRFRIAVKTRHEVTAIHPERKTVIVKNLKTGEIFAETYDKLLLSPGARPVRPSLPGIDSSRLFTLRTVEDTLAIRRFVELEQPRSAVLAGGGYIGLELAENLRDLGLEVTIVQRPKQLLNPFDPDMAAFIHAKLRSRGIRLLLGHSVEGFREKENTMEVLLKDAASVSVEVEHQITGEKTLISLAGPANRQGRIAADNICGGDSRYPGSQGSSIVKLFDMTAASTGINEKTAVQLGIDYDKVILSPQSHASYYPGGKMMTMKILWEKKSLRLLGAQIVGYDGVDKRIDVLAAAMYAGLSAARLKELDLAYAPPYSSAKDPVNMAGFLIESVSAGNIRQFHWNEADALPRDGSVHLLDVRTEPEFASGHLEGFVNIPLDELREHLDQLDPAKPVRAVCQSGLRSYLACRILSQEGFSCSHLSGGYRFYQTVLEDRCAAESAWPCGVDKT